ncbi:phosphocholine cytidylyltransferase family protein [Streptomyces rimosus]|uniref:phosphocholine cytidylyltransferase family protein n=1 Tax=Streptomyces rimosus TaxID=1927 RepID=UPI0037D6DC48
MAPRASRSPHPYGHRSLHRSLPERQLTVVSSTCKAVILSAGRGSRMGSLTADRPKSLLHIGGARLLDRQLAALRAARIHDIAVVTGWQAHRFNDLDLELFHNSRWAESDMTDSLACAEEWLCEGPTVVCYGDIVFPPAAVEDLRTEPGDIVVAYDPHWADLWTQRFTDPLSDAETFRLREDGTVRDIGDRPVSDDMVEGQYMGLFKTEPAGWRRIRSALDKAHDVGSRRDMTGILATLVAEENMRVRAVPVPGPWCEFDSVTDLAPGAERLARLDRLLALDRPTP